MKVKVKAKDFTSAVKTALAVHDFGESKGSRQPCLLTASEEGLMLESAKLGAYVIKKMPATLLRPGVAALNAEDLDNMKLSGEIHIEATDESTLFKDQRNKYNWSNDESAEKDITEQREMIGKVKAVAKIPTVLMKNGADFTTYKSETGDCDVQITVGPNKFEYMTLDFLGSARYVFEDDGVQAKDQIHFIFNTTMLGKVLKHATGDDMVIGTSKDGSIVRLKTADLDLFHPAIDKRYMSAENMIKIITKGNDSKCVCQFKTDQKTLRDAIGSVAPVGKKAEDAVLEMRVHPKHGVALHLDSATSNANSKIDAEKVKLAGKKPISIAVRSQYLQEFAKAAPDFPITIQSWNEKYLRMLIKEEGTSIEYTALMISE